ncbi:hypothetical protein OAO87_04730 [bacterium]|nr:hypothetical protein [bacterium]
MASSATLAPLAPRASLSTRAAHTFTHRNRRSIRSDQRIFLIKAAVRARPAPWCGEASWHFSAPSSCAAASPSPVGEEATGSTALSPAREQTAFFNRERFHNVHATAAHLTNSRAASSASMRTAHPAQ